MTRHSVMQAALGALLLALAVGALAAAHGTADAAGSYRDGRAQWQRGTRAAVPPAPGRVQRLGESLLGIADRSDLQRIYARYRAGLADVIPGTTYPQTRARYEAIESLRSLRGSLDDGHDRAAADVLLGTVLAESASGAGEQRRAQLDGAVAALARAAAEDPTGATAKQDLEILLRSLAPGSKSSTTRSGSATKKRPHNETPRGPTAPARAEGKGF
jgi:hypothetical protein